MLKKKFKKGEFCKLIEQSNKEFAFSLADASGALPELKTDSNLNDYINFKFCNSYKSLKNKLIRCKFLI